MKRSHISFVLPRVRHGVSVVDHPLVDVGPLTTLRYPHLGEDPPILSPRVRLGASEFDLYVVLLRCHSLEAPLFELLLGE